MARSGSGISAIFASRSVSPSAFLARGPRRAAAFSSWARSRIAARSSSVNPLDAWVAVRGVDCRVLVLAGFLSVIAMLPHVSGRVPADWPLAMIAEEPYDSRRSQKN